MGQGPLLVTALLLAGCTERYAAPAVQVAPTERTFATLDHFIELDYPADLTPNPAWQGTYFTSPGWRTVWDGAPVGPGSKIVRFALDGLPASPPDSKATEVLQIGSSRDPAVVSTCLTHGLATGNTTRLTDRVIDGRRFVAYRNGDAGMSHQMTASSLRAVIGDRCVAVDRLSMVGMRAVGEAGPARTQVDATAELDRVLASLRIEPAH